MKQWHPIFAKLLRPVLKGYYSRANVPLAIGSDMTQDEFNKAVADFDGGEPMRAQLYYSALRLIDAGFRIEAHLLILATWNFARFRYVTRTFNLDEYQRTLDWLTKLLNPLEGCELMDSDLKEYRTQIVQAFDKLACIEGIRFTGAAKILHLMYPLFL